MDLTQAEFKQKLLNTGLFRKVSGDGQYVCKTCPFCGDTKNHMYVLIKVMMDTPVLYNCFKCNARGIMNREFLEYFGIDDIDVPKVKNKRRIQPSGVSDQMTEDLFDDNDGEMIQMCTDYIQKRVGVIPSKNDLKAFQVIGNPVAYVVSYLGGDTKRLNDRIWFRLSNGCITGRRVDDCDEYRWVKRNISGNDPDRSKGLYIIKTGVDTGTTINVCICEGVMDAIGLYYHANISNGVYIACMGRDYMLGIKYMIDKGIFGDSVNVRIYKDSDVDYVRIAKKYFGLFKSISVYHNTLAKDYGVHGDMIEIEKCN